MALVDVKFSRLATFKSDKSRVISTFAAVLFGLTLLFTYSLLIRNSFYGFDISDEGMYLLSVHKITTEMAFHNPFGDFTRILYQLSGEKIWLYRVSGICLMGFAGVYVSSAFSRLYAEGLPRGTRQIIRISGLLISPGYYALGLLTPSYNWLNIVGMSIGLGAIFHIVGKNSGLGVKNIFHCFMLALGIWIGSFAKISTGLGLFCTFIGIHFVLQKVNKQFLKTLYATLLLLIATAIVHHLVISPIPTVIEKVRRGQDALAVFDPRYTPMLALQGFQRGALEWIRFLLVGIFPWTILTLGLIALAQRLFVRIKTAVWLSITLLLPIISFTSSYISGQWSGVASHYNEQMWAITKILGIAIAIAWCEALFCRTRNGRIQFWVSGCLLVAPVLYAIGSNNEFIEQMTGASGFLCLCAIFLTATVVRVRNGLVMVTSLVLSVGALATTIQISREPYRQIPYSQQDTYFQINNAAGSIYVDGKFAQNITQLKNQLSRSDWKARTPLLDFTQYSPGVVFALDARQPITVVPTVGGMPGVDALANWSYDYIKVHDDLNLWSSAWLLLPSLQAQENCQFCPDVQVLRKLGREFPFDYELVASSSDYRVFRPLD